MRKLILLLTLLCLAFYSSAAFAQKSKSKSEPVVCTVGTLISDAGLSPDRYAESVLDEVAVDGEEIPIISSNGEVCRTINSKGVEVFVPRSKVTLSKKLTRVGVLAKVVKFEKAGATENDLMYVRWVRFYDRLAEQAKGGELPPSTGELTDSLYDPPTVSIKNDTKYRITVTYSGATARSVTLDPNESRKITLQSGTYRVSASVNTGNVTPYYGKETMQSNYRYSVSYYIVTRRRD